MIKRTLTAAQVKAEPWSKWNAFVDLLALEELENLSPLQQNVSAIFLYNDEVENGGHLQYFLNQGIEHARITLEALKTFNHNAAIILQHALSKLDQVDLSTIEDVDDYVEMALDDHFDDYDQQHCNLKPDLVELIREILEKHEDEFLIITP